MVYFPDFWPSAKRDLYLSVCPPNIPTGPTCQLHSVSGQFEFRDGHSFSRVTQDKSWAVNSLRETLPGGNFVTFVGSQARDISGGQPEDSSQGEGEEGAWKVCRVGQSASHASLKHRMQRD